MPRLLIVVNIPRFYLTHRLPLTQAAIEAGYEVHVATSDVDTYHADQIRAISPEYGFTYHPLPLQQHGTNPIAEIRTFFALWRLYRQLQPDLIHQFTIKPVIYGGLAAQLAGVKAVVNAMSGLGVVFVDDSPKARLLRQLSKPGFWLALRPPHSHLIFQNPDDQRRFIELGLIDAAKTHLIRGSGVAIERFQPRNVPPGEPVVLFAGRLMWRKGLGDFVAAARHLRGRARFVVAGFPEATSPDNVPLAQLEAWRDEGLIEWWGRRDDMPEVYAQAHIVCLPSTYGEGVPKVLIEAAACGRPIVTTDTPGCREIVQHERNGLLTPPGDVAALVDALKRLLDDPSRRVDMGAQGRALVVQGFSLDQVNRATLALYERLLV